jgi:hypothetical protein
MKILIHLMISCFFCMPCTTQAKIHQHKTIIKFTKDAAVQQEEKEIPRFQSFKKHEWLFDYEKCVTPYSLQGGENYISLIPFFEWWQRSDFRVFPDKKHAVVFSVSCKRPCAAAMMAWECKLHATCLDSNGYVVGDMDGGDFVDVMLHPTQPYIILVRDGCCDSLQYAEIYDLEGILINKIDDYRKIEGMGGHQQVQSCP